MTAGLPKVIPLSIEVRVVQPGPLAEPTAKPQARFAAASPVASTAPAFKVLISDRSRAQSQSRIAFFQQASRLTTLKSVDDALVSVDRRLREMRDRAALAESAKFSGADRVAHADRVLALKKEIDRISTASLNGREFLPEIRVATKSALQVTGSVEPGAVFGANSVASIEGGPVATDTTFAFSHTGGSRLTLTDTTSGASQTIDLTALAPLDGTKVLDFDDLGVKITLTGGASRPGDLGAALDGETIALAASEVQDLGDIETLVGAIEPALARVAAQRTAVASELKRLTRATRDRATGYEDFDPAVLTQSVLRDMGALGQAVDVKGDRVRALLAR